MTHRGVWMHENSLDICFEVLRVQFMNHKKVIVKAICWNLGYSGNPWIVPWGTNVNGQFTLEIKRSDLAKYSNITSKMNNKRVKSGLPV